MLQESLGKGLPMIRDAGILIVALDVFTIDPGPATSVRLASDGDCFLAVFDRLNGSSSSDVLGNFVARE